MNSNFKCIALLLAVSARLAADGNTPAHATPQDMEDGVTQSFARATMLVQGLSALTTAADPYTVVDQTKARPEPKKKAEPVKVVPTAVPTPSWVGRHLGPLDRQTVFADFKVTVVETTPKSFDVTIISSAFCEEVVVKDRHTQAILARQSFDDEKLVKVSVTNHPLDETIELSIGVLDPNDSNILNHASVPLLGGTGINITP
jgi:hypothetical protein